MREKKDLTQSREGAKGEKGPAQKKVGIHFGCLVPDLAKQFAEQGVQAKSERGLMVQQRMADAICLLSVQGVLTSGEVHRARTQLMKKIIANVVPS